MGYVHIFIMTDIESTTENYPTTISATTKIMKEGD